MSGNVALAALLVHPAKWDLELVGHLLQLGLGGAAKLWDPINGSVKTIRMQERSDGRTLWLRLKGKQSMILTADLK